METTRRENLAWAAGFFDGEGYIGVGDKRGYARLAVNQVDRSPLDQFHSIVGVGNVFGPYPHGKWKPVFVYKAYGFEPVQAVIAMLWPWLSEFRREQASLILVQARKSLVARRTFTKGGSHCLRGHIREGNRTKGGACRVCVQDADRKRKRKR